MKVLNGLDLQGRLITNVAGLAFPATQIASADPNTLDDYEELPWTPTVTAAAGSLGSYSASGSYIKVGRLVVATGIVSISNNGTGGGALYVTLPFINNSGRSHFGAGRETTLSFLMLQALSQSGTGNALIVTYNNSYPGGTGATIEFTIPYHV